MDRVVNCCCCVPRFSAHLSRSAAASSVWLLLATGSNVHSGSRRWSWLGNYYAALLNAHLCTAWFWLSLKLLELGAQILGLPPVVHATGFVHVRGWMLTGRSHTHPVCVFVCVCWKCNGLCGRSGMGLSHLQRWQVSAYHRDGIWRCASFWYH